ncbi:MAG: Uma2 family endonuclease [Methyloprofundus sp.]|nr:Uma2 family endonuclease [Methyloprofundus sp.]
MSTVIKKATLISEEEYLKGELTREVRHEYVDGQIFAMAGVSPDHGRISGNIYRKFANHLENTACEPFISDMKVKTSTGHYRYPDVLVVCDKNFINNGYVTQTPTIIVEVLSRSTRKIDEKDKLLEYINIPTLKEYVLIEQDYADITVYRKSDDWRTTHYFLGEDIHFESIQVSLSVEEIYYRVENEDMLEFLESKKTDSI